MTDTINNKMIYKKALALAVPMMIQNGITNAVGLVDNLMVGSLGTECMTAVSIVGQLLFVFNLAIFGGLSGPGIYGAQYFGKGDIEGVKNVFRLKWLISLFCVISGLLIFIFGGSFLIRLYLKGESADIDAGLTLEYARQYLDIMLWQLLPFGITQVYAGSLRETGESFKPMVAGVISVITDIVLNYFLIYGKLCFPKLGVKGAAIATVIARFVELATLLIWAHAKKNKHTFLKKIYTTFKLDFEKTKTILKKGLPIFFNEFLWAGGIAILTQNYSLRGLDVVAGLNISNAICNLLNVVFIALGSAVGIISGQMLGASRYEEAKTSSKRLMWFSALISVILTIVLISIAWVFPNAYDTTNAIRMTGTKFIIITALFFPIQGFLNALYFTLRSGGKTFITFLFDSVYSWALPVPVAFVLCKYTSLNIFWVYTIIQMFDLIKLAVGYILINKGIWITNLVDSDN